MPPANWSHFSHSADMGIRGCGATIGEAFEQAAVGLTAIVTDPELVAQVECVRVRCEEADPELLFASWINEVIFQMATRRMLFSAFRVQTDGSTLEGDLWGESVDVARHQPAVEVKGATFTALQVREQDGSWTAQCVVDV